MIADEPVKFPLLDLVPGRHFVNLDAIRAIGRVKTWEVYPALMEHLPSDAKNRTVSAEPLPAELPGKHQQDPCQSGEVLFSRSIPGLDTALGLRRAMGLQDFYISMLQSFAESRRDCPQHIRAALSSHDMKKAEYLSHSLFGISAQIGALRVPRDAQELENAISSGTSPERIDSLLLRLEASLAELIEALQSSVPPIVKQPA